MMEWYWIYLIIGVCLYIIAQVTDVIEADGLFKRAQSAVIFILFWPKVVYIIYGFWFRNWLEARHKGRAVK
ncbi:hypothetical protein ABQ359_22190 [Serratia fonticola]|uniref:hypothetical protein n=1 Tax=Serratia fonticola TaxID=47917 RepID=UPI003AAAE700